jgi:hypothetical protein
MRGERRVRVAGADDMASLVRRWSELLIGDLLPSERLTAAAEATGSLLRPPATAAEVSAAELRLGTRLPPSYRQFLLVSNGAYGDDYGPSLRYSDVPEQGPRESAVLGVGFLPVQDVRWLRDASPGSAEVFAEMTDEAGSGPASVDGEEPRNWSPVSDGLLIATDKGPGTTVLVPFAGRAPGAEWQLWNVHFETATAYLSFASWLEREVSQREPLSLDLATTRALVDAPDGTWRARFEKLKLVDNPAAVDLLIWALNRPANEPTVYTADNIPDEASQARSGIAMAAGIALGRIKTDAAVAALVAADYNLAKQGLKKARTAAARDTIAAAGDIVTLDELGDPRAATLAAQEIATAGPIRRGYLGQIVGRSKDQQYLPLLLDSYQRCTGDQDRFSFAWALAKLGSTQGVDYLREMASADGPYAVSARNNLELEGWD